MKTPLLTTRTAVSSSISLLLVVVVVDMFTSARARIDSVSDSVNGSHSLGGTKSRVESHPESSGFHPVSLCSRSDTSSITLSEQRGNW